SSSTSSSEKMISTSLPPPDEPGLASFLRRVGLFLAPLVLGALTLFTVPYPRAFAYRFVKGDCWGRGIWIEQRIDVSPVPVDVAFLGTSRTIHAIDDARIEALLEKGGVSAHVVNLGYCRNGRNLHEVIARDLLEAKDVKDLVIEVSDTEFGDSHPMFGYLARTDDLLAERLRPNLDYARDLFHGLVGRFERVRADVLPIAPPAPPGEIGLHGGAALPRVAEPEAMAAKRAKRRARAAAAPERGREAFPRQALGALAKRAKDRGARLHFLYLPSYGEPWARMANEDLYRALGDVWIPPREIFDDPTHWMDPNHLNVEGARALATWLAERIQRLERSTPRGGGR
ncbi:MAG: hypothetical protein ACC662_03690, partial [Planctomycetota bacterium]